MGNEFVDIDPEEEARWRREHEEMHARHKGHDAMHAEMFLIFIIALVVAQVLLVMWKRYHFRSYQLATLVGLWLIPVWICAQKGWWRFIVTWALFSAASGYVWYRVKQPSISGGTPRLVYKYFLALHKLSYVLGIAGYLLLMATLLGVNLIFRVHSNTTLDWGVCLLFYGLYYGVLGRDVAHICTDMLACKIGYYTREGLPKRVLEPGVCAVCGDPVERPDAAANAATSPDTFLGTHNKLLVTANGGSSTHLQQQYSGDEDAMQSFLSAAGLTSREDGERRYTLSCQHSFHEFCIRGWCVVGKQQTCPYCKEKVDLKRMFKNPWEKPHLFYGQLLDWIRYLVAWQPLIVTVVQAINRWLGLE